MYQYSVWWVIGVSFIIFSCQNTLGQNDKLRINLKDGEYHMPEDEIKELKRVSKTFRQDVFAADETKELALRELAKSDLKLIVAMIKNYNNKKLLQDLLKKEQKNDITQLYDLYEYVRFLDISSLRKFIQKEIEAFIFNAPTSVLEKIKIDGKDLWFVNAVSRKIGRPITFSKDSYNFIFSDGLITQPLSEKKRIEKLAYFSEVLKTYKEDTQDRDFLQPLYLIGIDAKSFKKIYTLIDILDNRSTLAQQLSQETLDSLSSILKISDYLQISILFDMATEYFVKKIIEPNALEKFKNKRNFLSLSPYIDHMLALKVASALNIVGQTYSCKTSLENESPVHSVAWSPNGSMVAIGLSNSTVQIWDVTQSILIHTVKGHTDLIFSVAWSPDGTMLATGSADKTVQIWDTTSWKSIHLLTDHWKSVHCIAWSFDGKMLATASSDKTVQIWDAEHWTLLHTLEGHTDWIYSIAWKPKSMVLATASGDKTVQLWNANQGTLVNTLSEYEDTVNVVAWSPDGTMLAVGLFDKTVQIWDMQIGALKKILDDHAQSIHSLSWSPDGTLLASASWDNTVKIWSTKNWALVDTLEKHKDFVYSVAWSPDGSMLATGSNDQTVILWCVITHKDLKSLTLDQIMLIALAQQEYRSGKPLVLNQKLRKIFKSFDTSLQKFLKNIVINQQIK